jgi:molecular chaperone IbpA|tara:strand:+ start:95 stop:511 length:417 start_codon:yes stop_codon:yes gene_type:complete
MNRVTTLTLPDFHKTLLGFDRLVEDFQSFNNAGYPPYNVEKSGDDKYQITIALAGFVREDLTIDVQEGTLTVSGEKAEVETDEIEYLHRGIANRSFTRNWALAEYVEVVEAKMENGMLYVSLERIVPEEKKPKTIKIK